MTTTTTHRPSTAAPGPASGGGLPGGLRAEWTKLWGLRSTWICLAVTLLVAGSTAWAMAYQFEHLGNDAMAVNSLASTIILLPQFIAIAVASLIVTGEYATGAMRTTLTTVPRRGRMLASKAIVLSAVSSATGAAIGLLCLAAIAAVFGDRTVTDPDTLGYGVLGIAFYLLTISLLTLGLGTVLRSTAGTVTTVIGLLAGIPMIQTVLLQMLGENMLTRMAEYTPAIAGRTLMSGEAGTYGWEAAAVILAAWAAAGLAAGYTALRARDA